jgi:hypothetical protein
MALSGCLTKVGQDSFTLVEQESGDRITVKGPVELLDHVGHTVEVTGTWSEDSSAHRYFKVTKVKQISSSCEPTK